MILVPSQVCLYFSLILILSELAVASRRLSQDKRCEKNWFQFDCLAPVLL